MKKALYLIICIALGVAGCTTESDRMRMRAGLDSINVRNRNGQPFTVAEVQSYADFFDEHGTPNDRLLAHYLLGLAYSDHGEAPMALRCYQDAIDCADTLSADCDYAQLARVYGQMAEVFYYQGVYKQNIDFQRKAVKYAWLGKDTLAGLMYYEQISFAYIQLKDTLSAMEVIEEVAKKYNELGYPSDAVITLGGNIRLLIDMGDYDKAKDYINMYEAESGRFDSCGNIEAGREIYYKSKGLYYLYTNKWDSAEYYFRKEMRDGKDFSNQNSAAYGLALNFQITHQPDSATKYALYAYAMLDSVYAQRTTEEIERLQAMYNYTRHQEIAYQEQEKANRRTVIIWICVGIIIAGCLTTIIVIRELTRKKKAAEQKYLQSQSAIEQAQSDIAKLCKNEEANSELISEKEQIIREQETIMRALLQRDTKSQSLADRRLRETAIYEEFEQLSVIGQKPTNAEWEQMKEQIFKYYPGFKDFMSKHFHQLNDKEYKTCLLIRMDFKPKMISHMLEVDPSYISNIRADMFQKLFQLSGNSKAFDKMLKEIY